MSCKACNAGQFQDDEGAVACKNCSTGQFSNTAAQPLCTNCFAGQHQDVTGQTDCKGTPCVAGRFHEAGQTSAVCCKDCPRGKWSSGSAPNCTACVAGQFGAGATRSITHCKLCSHGRFSNGTAQAFCDKWTVCTAPDDRTLSQGSRTTDRTCEPCTNGTRAAASNADTCALETCEIGKFQKDTTVGCKDCPTGMYQDAVGRDRCKAARDCSEAASARCRSRGQLVPHDQHSLRA